MKFVVYRDMRSIPGPIAEGLWEILEQSFPLEERRCRAEMQALLDSAELELVTAQEDDRLQGFLMLWNLEEFIFIENFAVAESTRGRGLGSQMLSYVTEHWDKPQILEVEPPDTEICRRRIAFYQRNKFFLNQFPYRMPCLHGNGPAVPLLLMSKPEALTGEQAEQVKADLYRVVYAGKPVPEAL